MRLSPPIIAAIALGLSGSAYAQAPACRAPAVLPRPTLEGPTSKEPRRQLPIGGYTLSIVWSPQYCRGKASSAADRIECGGAAGRFGFTLHGLWPDGRGESWPQYCRPATALLPEALIRKTICATPSPQLQQHEWAKHGTCMAATPDAYFASSTALYRALRYPDMAALAADPNLTVDRFAAAFAAANPGRNGSMVKVNADRQGWLDEVWLCLDTGLKPKRCASNGGAARRDARLRIERPVD